MTKKNGQNQPVYYISPIASDEFGKPENEYFTFDEGSRIDLEDTDVKFRDVHALLDEYKVAHPMEKIKEISVYDLLEDLIKRNPKASFFVDECPFIMNHNRLRNAGTLRFNNIDNIYHLKLKIYYIYILLLFCSLHKIFHLNF